MKISPDYKRKEDIKKYWNERALQHKNDPAATTNDIYLRKLEIKTILQTLNEIQMTSDKTILDVGCADGYSTIKLAEALPNVKLIGIDYGQDMIKIANEKLNSQPDLKGRLKFKVGDASNLKEVCGESLYDIILTDRLLINLDSLETQRRVISEISDHLKERGYLIVIENFIEGHENMNKARQCVGLSEIPLRWHNLFLKKKDFLKDVNPLFELISFNEFASAYYFATRVVYSKMCHMNNVEPDYSHDIHKLSVDLPWFGEFSPVKMAVMRKRLKS